MTNQLNEQVAVTEEVVTEVVEVTETETVETPNNDEVVQRLENSLNELEQSLAEREQVLAKLEKQMERTNFITSLAEEGLTEFQGLFGITDTNEQVAFIKNAVNQILVKHSYQPKDVAKQEQYTQAIQSKDVESAIGFKFANFFKK